ncbi:MAG: hypothetical protein ACYDCQ_14515 [Dehalococcoidia bacterium]
MPAERTPIDISNNPSLRQLVNEARAGNSPRPLVIDNQVVATLVPADGPYQRPRHVRRTSTGRNAWLLDIVGIATGLDDGIHDAAEHHDRYLADAGAHPSA